MARDEEDTAEDIQWLAENGGSAAEAWERLEFSSYSTFEKWCARHDLKSEFSKLQSRNPEGWTEIDAKAKAPNKVAQIAKSVLENSTSANPDDLADEFVSRVPTDLYRDALVLMARSYMRQHIVSQRHANVTASNNTQGSKKVAAARDAWKRLLDTPEYVESAGWIFLRDATHDQVMEMASSRRQKAQELSSAADRYAALAKAMQDKSVARVADLPDDTLEHLLEAAAA